MTSPYPQDWNSPVFPGGGQPSSVPYVSSPLAGDLLIMNMVCNGATTIPPAGEGWNIKHYHSATATSLVWKWATGTEGANTGAWGGSNYYHLWMYRIRGLAYPTEVPTHDPFDGSIQYGWNVAASSPSQTLTTSQADCLLLFCDMNFGTGVMSAPPAGMTSWYAASNYVHAAYEYRREAGAVGSKSATYEFSAQNHSLLYAIKGHVPEIVVGGVKTPAKSIATINNGAKRTATGEFTTNNQVKQHMH